jgi:hypothetical protein
MLISSPRATFPLAGTSGAAVLIPVIFGACASASPAAAKMTIPGITSRVGTGSRMIISEPCFREQ